MLGLLDDVEEYNNAGSLIGLDALADQEVIGALKKMNPIKRQKTVNKLANTGSHSKGSRAEMEKFFPELPQHIKSGLAKGELRLADTLIYSIKQVTGKTIKMFETQDDKQIGLRNISNAKLPKNQAMLVSGVYLLAATATDTTVDKVMSASYKGLENFPALLTGETNLKANKKQIFPEINNQVFATANHHNVPIGYYKLSNPRLIQDDIQIELTVELGTMDGIPANTYIYAALHGTITTP